MARMQATLISGDRYSSTSVVKIVDGIAKVDILVLPAKETYSRNQCYKRNLFSRQYFHLLASNVCIFSLAWEGIEVQTKKRNFDTTFIFISREPLFPL